jgi:two-component system chemotaxis response regulator CheB
LVDEDPAIEIVEIPSGREAIERVAAVAPSVILMDVVMPGLDGYATARAIMARRPTPIVLISSVVDPRTASTALEALRAGALWISDDLPAPSDPTYRARRAALAQVLRAMANVDVKPKRPLAPPVARDRSRPRLRADAIGIAASTGGPQALEAVLRALPRSGIAPILIVQHLARGFTSGFANWLATTTAREVEIARDGALAREGTVYVAPEGAHLAIDRGLSLGVRDEPPVGPFRPSATFLFESLAAALGPRAAGVVLTGMGSDGAVGLASLHARGGATAAQDETTSVVFGMPRAAIELGVVDDVLPLSDVAAWIVRRCAGPT